MKNKSKYLIIAAQIAAMPLMAMNSELSVSTSDYSKFTLIVDNYLFGTPSNTFNVTNLSAGYHRIRMQREGQLYNGRMGVPMETVYDGYVNFPSDTKVIAVSPVSGSLNVVSMVPLSNGCGNSGGGYGGGYGNGGCDNSGGGNGSCGNGGCGNGNCGNGGCSNCGCGCNNGGYGNGGCNNGGCGHTGDGNNGSGHGGWGNGGNGNNPHGGGNPNPPVGVGMPRGQFEALKATIQSKSFESTKLTVAAQALQANMMSAQQVKELMDLMSFESTKLTLAKAAYGRTVDRQNYYLVDDAFDFESSVTELAQYINSYH